MTSLSGIVLATDAPSNSEPESLDSLDFDDWEGQFEFIGNNNNQQQNKHPTAITQDVEDLNLSVPRYGTIENRSILIDEETFLSLQLNDNDYLKYDPENEIDGQTPPNYLINNALKHYDHTVPSDLNDKQRSSTDDIVQTKNRLNHHKLHRNDKNNNQCDVKMNKNRFANELCDSLLKEQVSYFLQSDLQFL